MPNNSSPLKDIKSLEQLRDELKLKLHLFKADMKDEWTRIEADWQKLQGQMKPVQKAAEKTATDVKVASERLFETVKRGYERIKGSLPS